MKTTLNENVFYYVVAILNHRKYLKDYEKFFRVEKKILVPKTLDKFKEFSSYGERIGKHQLLEFDHTEFNYNFEGINKNIKIESCRLWDKEKKRMYPNKSKEFYFENIDQEKYKIIYNIFKWRIGLTLKEKMITTELPLYDYISKVCQSIDEQNKIKDELEKVPYI